MNAILTAERVAFGQVQFATVCLVMIDSGMSSAQVILGGHPPPMLLASGGAHELEVTPGPPIGVDTGSQWRATTIDLPDPPWSLLVYTDGLTEGRSSPGGPRPFGHERLLAILAGHAPPLDNAALDAILAAAQEANGGPMLDDVVMVGLSPA